MNGKLLIAKFQGKFIHFSKYQETVHHGELYCPFCNPPIRVTHNVKGFFMAWKDEGGHNCRDINVNYFDAEWEGKEYIEIISDKEGKLDVTIDINEIVKPVEKINPNDNDGGNQDIPYDSDLEFPKYKSKEKVFRDVITSVFQMKKLVEKNDFNDLKKLNFKFKTDKSECLNFSEIVFKCNEIGKAPNYKNRFFIFDVEKIAQVKGKVYINSFIRDGYQIVGTLEYPHPIQKLKKKFEGQYAIAYGYFKRDKSNNNKAYLTLSNDFQIVKLNSDEVEYLFSGSNKQKFVPKPKLVEEIQQIEPIIETKKMPSKDIGLPKTSVQINADSSVNSTATQRENFSQQNVDEHPKRTENYLPTYSHEKSISYTNKSYVKTEKSIFKRFFNRLFKNK